MISYNRLKQLNNIPSILENLDEYRLNYIINEYSSYGSIEELDEYFKQKTNNIIPYNDVIRPVVKCLFELNEIFDDKTKIKYYNLLIKEQQDIIKLSYDYMILNDKAIWNLFCRYGKTMLSAIFTYIMSFNKILILVPSLYLVEQTYLEWIKYFPSNDILQISHLDNYKDKLSKHILKKRYIIICVYNSSYVIKNVSFDIGIFDEAHRTARYTIDNEISYNQLLLKTPNIKKRLFLTATIKEYNETTDYTMNNLDIYGPIIAQVSAKRAKEIGRLSDYKLLCILIKDDINQTDYNIIDDCYNYLVKTFDKTSEHITKEFLIEYLKIAKSLYETITTYDIKHTITYHLTINRCQIFNWLYNIIAKSKTISNYIKGEHTKIERNNIIKNFISRNNSILSSCKTLQEGVNIPDCDATCFVDVKTSVIDTIQSASRCLTKTNTKKIAYIILPFFGDNTKLLKEDTRTNNLRLILKNLIEVDQNLKEAFEHIEYKFDSKSQNINTQLTNDEIIIDPNVIYSSLIINQLRTVSYDTYTQAKEQINCKYATPDDYKLNIKKDFNNNIPSNPDIIYKRTGWNGWQIYLNSSDNQLDTKYRLKEIFKKINLYEAIDIYKIIQESNYNDILINYSEINIYKLLNYTFNSFVYFEQFINKFKIKSYEDYINIFNIDNKFPYCPYEYYREFEFDDTKWFSGSIKKKLII